MDNMSRRDLFYVLDSIENAAVPLADALPVAERIDPLLMYFLLRYLRENYSMNRGNSGPGLRLAEFLSTYPSMAKLAKSPKNEPMVEWFDDSYSVREFANRDDYFDLIIEKFEG